MEPGSDRPRRTHGLDLARRDGPWARIALVVTDFDGVLTDNTVLVSQEGVESVRANRSDGLAVDLLQGVGIPVVILSSEHSGVTLRRAEKLEVPAIVGQGDKRASLSTLCRDRAVDPADVLYLGNDVNDLGAIGLAGASAAPADAHPAVRDVVDHVTAAPGGGGVLRELADLLVHVSAPDRSTGS